MSDYDSMTKGKILKVESSGDGVILTIENSWFPQDEFVIQGTGSTADFKVGDSVEIQITTVGN